MQNRSCHCDEVFFALVVRTQMICEDESVIADMREGALSGADANSGTERRGTVRGQFQVRTLIKVRLTVTRWVGALRPSASAAMAI